MLTPVDKPLPGGAELFDAPAIAAELATLAGGAGNEHELRLAVTRRLKTALIEGRRVAEQLLLKDRRGRRCAERLCRMLDDIIGVLFEFATAALPHKTRRIPSAWPSSPPAAMGAA